MLSKADVAKALTMMQRFEPLLIVDDIAVEAWHIVLVDVVPDADTLAEGVKEWALEDTNRNVRPSTLMPYVERIVEQRQYAEQEAAEQARLMQLVKDVMKERGLTAADYNADEALREDIGREAWQRRRDEHFAAERQIGAG